MRDYLYGIYHNVTYGKLRFYNGRVETYTKQTKLNPLRTQTGLWIMTQELSVNTTSRVPYNRIDLLSIQIDFNGIVKDNPWSFITPKLDNFY